MHRPLPIFRATQMREAGVTGSTLRRRTASTGPDRLVRVGPNAFTRGSDWDAAGPRQRYVTRVHARLARLSRSATASHASAAALHGLPWLAGWPVTVHATVPPSQYRGPSATLHLHTRALGDEHRMRRGDISVTTVARTVVDIALAGPVRDAVVVADAALRDGVSRHRLDDVLGAFPDAPGRTRARHVLRFADARAASVAESLARVVLREIGAPDPVLQQRFVVDGRRYDVDFWFPDHGLIVEIDGRAKYTQSRYANGRTQEQVFIDEKRRHERLLTIPTVRLVIRVEWRDLWDPEQLIRRLRAAGLPCWRRPAKSAVGLLA